MDIESVEVSRQTAKLPSDQAESPFGLPASAKQLTPEAAMHVILQDWNSPRLKAGLRTAGPETGPPAGAAHRGTRLS